MDETQTPPPERKSEEQTRRERMFEAEMANQQLEQINEYLERIDKQTAEVMTLKEAVDEYLTVAPGDELLVPMAAGIFVPATARKEKTFHVNVGQGIVVPKTAAEVHAMLDKQLSEMRAYGEGLHTQFDQLLARLQAIQQEFDEDAKEPMGMTPDRMPGQTSDRKQREA